VCSNADFLSRLVEVNTQERLIGVINDARTRAVSLNAGTGETEYNEVAFGNDNDSSGQESGNSYGGSSSDYSYEAPEPPAPQTTCQGKHYGTSSWNWGGAAAWVRAPRMLSETTTDATLTSAMWNSQVKCAVRPPAYNHIMDCDWTTGAFFRRVCWCSDV